LPIAAAQIALRERLAARTFGGARTDVSAIGENS
jgi:hypothetical protein